MGREKIVVLSGEQGPPGPPGPPGESTPPVIGEVREFTTDPGAGWLLCDGASHLRIDYPQYETLRPVPAWVLSADVAEDIGTEYDSDYLLGFFYTGQSLLAKDQNYLYRSVDGGRTFSLPYEVPGIPGDARFHKLPSGRLVLVNGPSFTYTHTNRALFSDDDGLTWTASTSTLEAIASVSTVANGRIVVLFKGTNRGAFSTDGDTWTQVTLAQVQNHDFLTAADPALWPKYFYGWTLGDFTFAEYLFNADNTNILRQPQFSYLQRAAGYVPLVLIDTPDLGPNDTIAISGGSPEVLHLGNSVYTLSTMLPAKGVGGYGGRTDHGVFVTDCISYGRFTKFMWSYDSGLTWEYMEAPAQIGRFANDVSFTFDTSENYISAYQGGDSWMIQFYSETDPDYYYGYFRVSHDATKFNAPGLEAVGGIKPYVYVGA